MQATLHSRVVQFCKHAYRNERNEVGIGVSFGSKCVFYATVVSRADGPLPATPFAEQLYIMNCMISSTAVGFVAMSRFLSWISELTRSYCEVRFSRLH